MSPPPYAHFIRSELQLLKANDWAAWRTVIRRAGPGIPFPCLYALRASTNAIHQAYHLCRFQVQTTVAIHDFDFVLEFGGGYGEMRRIIHKLGFSGQYAIFDLPELTALQRYYLGPISALTKTMSELESTRAALQAAPQNSRKLFIATWSFDETPLETREVWIDLLAHFDAFLIAYQASFGDIDNHRFFADLQTRLPLIRWTAFRIPHLKDSFYLFGLVSSEFRAKAFSERT